MSAISILHSFFSTELIVAIIVFFILLRIFAVLSIITDSYTKNRHNGIILGIVAIIFPLISEFIYFVIGKKKDVSFENNRNQKKISTGLLIISIICTIVMIFLIMISYINAINNAYDSFNEKYGGEESNIAEKIITDDADYDGYYDMKGNHYNYLADVVYYSKDGKRYTTDFQTVTCLDNDNESYPETFCYVDKNGYFYYDENKEICVEDGQSFTDDNGNIYYPLDSGVRYVKEGQIVFSMPQRLYYDKYGYGYVDEDCVPFYDKNDNKYFYTFDSDKQKGFFSTIDGKIIYPSDNCYVSSNGYLVCDLENRIKLAVENDNIEKPSEYKDNEGNVYYRTVSIVWNSDGEIVMR